MTPIRITDPLVQMFGRIEAEIERAIQDSASDLDREDYQQRLRQVRAGWEAFLATGMEAPTS